MKANFIMIKSMDKELKNGTMGENMSENGKMENSMALAYNI